MLRGLGGGGGRGSAGPLLPMPGGSAAGGGRPGSPSKQMFGKGWGRRAGGTLGRAAPAALLVCLLLATVCAVWMLGFGLGGLGTSSILSRGAGEVEPAPQPTAVRPRAAKVDDPSEAPLSVADLKPA